MTEFRTRRPVVAGVSPLAERTAVLRWAAQEAVRRNRPLKLVHTYQALYYNDAMIAMGRAVALDPIGVRVNAEATLHQALRWVVERYPELTVTSYLAEGAAAATLAAESEQAELMVVGTHDQGKLASTVFGSVAASLISSARCPVVAVPADIDDFHPGDRVVAGVDLTATSQAALEFAFEAASRYHQILYLVHSWGPPRARMGREERIRVRDEHHRQFAEATAGFAERYPDVRVVEILTGGDPVAELAWRSGRASLLVLGSRGRAGVAAALLGSVSRDVVRQSSCPVAVVRPEMVAAPVAGR